jgi:hypothetical protein
MFRELPEYFGYFAARKICVAFAVGFLVRFSRIRQFGAIVPCHLIGLIRARGPLHRMCGNSSLARFTYSKENAQGVG